MELLFYQTTERRRPFEEWLGGLRDLHALTRIEARLARLAAGNFGDCASVGGGVMELRIDWGARTSGNSCPVRRRQEETAEGYPACQGIFRRLQSPHGDG